MGLTKGYFTRYDFNVNAGATFDAELKFDNEPVSLKPMFSATVNLAVR